MTQYKQSLDYDVSTCSSQIKSLGLQYVALALIDFAIAISDWPMLSFPHQNVDALLRCPICFDFVSIAMMTKCSHNCKYPSS